MDATNLQSILSEIKQLNVKYIQIDNKIKAIENKLMMPQSNINQKNFIGDIITIFTESEIKTLFDWLSMNNDNIGLKLLYHPLLGKEQDKINKAKCRCGNHNPLLILIETTEGCKFGGYSDITFKERLSINSGQSQMIVNGLDVFVFSFEKKQIQSFSLEPNYPIKESFSLLFNDIFGLNDYFMFSNNAIASKLTIHNTIKEFNNGKNTFTVKQLFIYEVKYSN